MQNLSQQKRQRMLDFLEQIKSSSDDEKTVIAINEIENELVEKKYGLVWEKHIEQVDEDIKANVPVFTEVEDRAILSGVDDSCNFLLEGDNLHSLKLLEKTHAGKIDCIYIDPPYNTGNKDFIYDDVYVDSADNYRHSKWVSFMAERLKIARNLLTNEGCIFLQINDIEFAQLKMLCDEIFGEENFLNIVSVNMKNIAGASGGGEDKRLKKNCEYVLIYAKNYALLPLFSGPYVYTKLSEMVKKYEEDGKSWKYTTVLLNEGIKEYVGSTVDGDGNEIKIYIRKNPEMLSVRQVAKRDNISEEEVYNKYGTKIFQTTNAQSSIRTRVMDFREKTEIKEDLISIEYIPKTGKNKGKMYEQFYKGDKCRLFVWLKDTAEEIDGQLYKKDLQGTYWDANGWMKNLTKEGDVEFAKGKKPVDLIKQIISLYPQKECTILDFFAGSGTTGHAVLSVNEDDGGNRKFILCTNNQNKICEQVTYKRLKNVICGYSDKKGIQANLRYYKTEMIPKSKDDSFYSVGEELEHHIKEMIQLERGISLDTGKYLLILNDEDAEKLDKKDELLKECKAVYISSAVFLNKSQQKLLSGVDVITIPDYYFEEELREVGEL
jgi:adenine-specific DNA-methyltransferase